LITDGLSNAGLSSEETLTSLQNLSLPPGCIFYTFGFGEDHDSKLLHAIALKTQGVYEYVPSKEYIHKIFSGCVHAVLSSRARLVKINIQALDGSRIISLATPFQITQKKVAKEYDVNVGLMYSGEFKSILFRLSLRKMENAMRKHPLLKVNVEYHDIENGCVDSISTELFVERLNNNLPDQIPVILDENLNRYQAARAIIESIELGNRLQFSEAQKKIDDCIKSIRKSPSGKRDYCIHLMEDLRDCMNGMQDLGTFQSGVHSAHAYASMYYMERSSGVELRKQLNSTMNNNNQNGLDMVMSYGYLTETQMYGQNNISSLSKNLLERYSHSY